MHDQEESDGCVVPGKLSNKGRAAARLAEEVEERRPTKGNSTKETKGRAQDRITLQQNLRRVREVAARDKELQFTTLWHHVYNVDHLRAVFFQLKKNAAPGVDRVTWQTYAGNLEKNLQDLSCRLKRGAYRAKPVRRVFIPKPDGRKRPLGIPTLEDKLVQGVAKLVLEQIYETDFIGFSYGCRPKRSPHGALDALVVGIERQNGRRQLHLPAHCVTGSATERVPLPHHVCYPSQLEAPCQKSASTLVRSSSRPLQRDTEKEASATRPSSWTSS